MQIITGKTGSPHVSAEDDRAKHAGTYGTGAYILNTGNKFAATVESSTNSIRITDGDGMVHGTHVRIPQGDYDDVSYNPGSNGYIRKDLIVVRYTKTGTIEDIQFVMKEGELATSDPQVPEHIQGNILEGDIIAEEPWYEVTIDCTVAGKTTISISELLVEVLPTLDNMYDKGEIDYIAQQLQKSIDDSTSIAQQGVNAASTAQTTANEAVSTANDAKSTVLKNKEAIQATNESMSAMEGELNQRIADVETALMAEIASLADRVGHLEGISGT